MLVRLHILLMEYSEHSVVEALHDDKIINDAQLPITNPDANSIKIMIGDTFKNKKEQIILLNQKNFQKNLKKNQKNFKKI